MCKLFAKKSGRVNFLTNIKSATCRLQEAFVFLKRNRKRFSRVGSGVKIEDLSEEQEKGQMMGGHAKEKRDPGKGRTGLVVLSSLTKDLPFPVCATKVHKRWG